MRYDRVWRAQWTELRSWIDTAKLLDAGDEPSVLSGWSVRDLVAHLGRGFTASSVEESSEPPLTIRQYVTGYAGAAEEVEAEARVVAAERSAALLEWLDQVAIEAFERIGSVTTPVVRGRRGPITRDDFVLTRLLELVVHGDDLARSVPAADGSPLIDDAVGLIARTLADCYVEIAGSPPAVNHDIEWIRAATGRVPTGDAQLPLL